MVQSVAHPGALEGAVVGDRTVEPVVRRRSRRLVCRTVASGRGSNASGTSWLMPRRAGFTLLVKAGRWIEQGGRAKVGTENPYQRLFRTVGLAPVVKAPTRYRLSVEVGKDAVVYANLGVGPEGEGVVARAGTRTRTGANQGCIVGFPSWTRAPLAGDAILGFAINLHSFSVLLIGWMPNQN